MGQDPRDSVVDPWGRLWGLENLFVADAAALPAGLWHNVTLTVMALAVRTCERIRQTR